MTLRECYTAMGGDYEEVISRLRRDTLVEKFVRKFPSDGSYELLCTSLRENNEEEAFRAAHTLKGVCQNLGLTRLLASSSQLTEALRHRQQADYDRLLQQVSADYQQTVQAIDALDR